MGGWWKGARQRCKTFQWPLETFQWRLETFQWPSLANPCLILCLSFTIYKWCPKMKCFNLTTANPDLDIAHSAFWHYLADLYILRTLAACWRVVSLLLFLLRPLPGLPSTRQTTFMLQKRVWNVTVLSRSRGEQTGAWQSQGRVGGAAVSLVTHPGHAGQWQLSLLH